MVVMPVICIVVEILRSKSSITLSIVIKWVLFWSVGIRSLSAGLVQFIYPQYTAKIIFNLTGTDFYIFIRELGIANTAIGLSAIISFKIINWRVPVSFISLIFNLFLSLNHIINFQAGFNEVVSLIGDLLIVLILSVFLIRSLKRAKIFPFTTYC